MTIKQPEHRLLLWGVTLLLIASGIEPQSDHLTWLLETLPVMIGIVLLTLSWARFPLTPIATRLLALHAVILIIGGYYSYAQMPLFNWLKEAFDLDRNYYDRVGHFVQGFVPAIIAREILIRCTPLRPGGWLFLLVTSVCLAISAFYELIEWWVALLSGDAATAFLATQGDIWDTQWDMFIALIGAMCAQLLLSGIHDRQLGQLDSERR